MTHKFLAFGITAAALVTACSNPNGGEPDGAFQTLPNTYTVVASGESTPTGAAPGDPVGLAVDIGASTPLASTASVSWYGQPQIAVAPATPGPGLPAFGSVPTGVMLQYPPTSAGGRSEVPASVANTLFVLDEGTGVDANGNPFPLSINALVIDDAHNAGLALPWDAGGLAPGSVSTAAPLTGDPDAGMYKYGANCAACHGATAAGSPPTGGDADAGLTYTLYGDAGNLIPAPALPTADLTTQGLFVFASLIGVDGTGAVVQEPMPILLATQDENTGANFTNQDVSDIYAWLTQAPATAGSTGSTGSIGSTGTMGTTSGSVGTTGASGTTSGSTGTTGTSGETTGTTSGAATTGTSGTTSGATTGTSGTTG